MTIYSKTNPPTGFYVYAYLRDKKSILADKGTPYYIGKGSGKRAWIKGEKEKIKPPKDKNLIVILESNLSEVGAYAIERRYIKWYGRVDMHDGILRNRTEGGDGIISMPKTTEHKNKISLALTGIKRPYLVEKLKRERENTTIVKDLNGNFFIANTNDVRFLTGEIFGINKGKLASDKTKENISNGLKGKTKGRIMVKDADGKIFKVSSDDPRYVSGELVSPYLGVRKNYKTITCQHCGIIGKGPNMTRYHGNNCSRRVIN